MIHWTRFIRRFSVLGGILLWSAGYPAEHYTIPLFAPAGTSESPRSVLRIVNAEDESGMVEIWAIDDAGNRTGPVAFTLDAGAAAEFDAMDLVSGNPTKGLSGSIGPLEGDVRLEIDADTHILPLAYARAADGTLSAMHDMAPAAAIGGLVVDQVVGETGSHRYVVPMFNPASEAARASRLRLVNPGDTPASVTVGGRDDSGAAAPGGVLRLTLPAGGARTLTALELEAGGEGLQGRLGAGVGKWRLTVASDRPLQAVSVAAAGTGWYWNNLSTAPNAETVSDSMSGPARAERYTIPLFAAPGVPGGPQGVLRIVNGTVEAGTVAVHAIDDVGVRTGPATFTLGALAAAEFTAAELASGDPARGLSNGIGPFAGDVRLEIGTDLPIMALAYARAADGALSAMHDTVPAEEVDGADGQARSYRYEVPLFNSASEAVQASRLRLVNPGDAPATVTIGGRDDSGAAAPGGGVRLTLPPGGARTLTALELEAGGAGLQGRLGAGIGRWRLTVTSDRPLQTVNVMMSGAGYLNNLSTVAAEVDGADGASDFDLDGGNGRPEGIAWAGGRYYVVDAGADKVFAYGADGQRDAVADFDLDNENNNPTGIASSGTSFHVVDESDDKVYAYAADGSRDAASDFDLDADNGRPEGIVWNGARFYVVDRSADKVFAYGAGGQREASLDFDLGGGNGGPSGIAWADGRFYVTDTTDDKVYAYDAAGQPEASLDFDLDAENGNPAGIVWADGPFYVADSTDDKVYSYARPTGPGGGTPTDAQPSFAAGSAPGDLAYTVGTAIDALTLPAAEGGDGALTYTLAPDVPGLSFDAAVRRLTGTPTVSGTYVMTYAVTDADGDTATLGFAIAVDAVGGEEPAYGIGDTITGLPAGSWVPDAMSGSGARVASGTDGIRVEFDEGGYIEVGGHRFTCRSTGGCELVDGTVLSGSIAQTPAAGTPAIFDLHISHYRPRGITYGNGRLHVVDWTAKKVYAYRPDGQRDPDADFDLAVGNGSPGGIAYADGRFYVLDTQWQQVDDSWVRKVYAYRSNGQRYADADFNLDRDNGSPGGIVYADDRFYVLDRRGRIVNSSWIRKVYAYRIDGQRDADADFDLDVDNGSPGGIAHADGRFYVLDLQWQSSWVRKVYAYRPDGQRDTDADFDLGGDITWPQDIAYADDRFHVVETSLQKVYAYRTDGQRDTDADFNLGEDRGDPVGVAYADGRFHVLDRLGRKVYAYLDSWQRDAVVDFHLHGINSYEIQRPFGFTYAMGRFYLFGQRWAGASWVNKVYAFRPDGQRDSGADFDLHEDNGQPLGIAYADGRFYVTDAQGGKVYAYRPDGQRDTDADFYLDRENGSAQRIAYADGRFHILDTGDRKVYAYRSDGQRDPVADFNLHESVIVPTGITYARGRFFILDSSSPARVYAWQRSAPTAAPTGVTVAEGARQIAVSWDAVPSTQSGGSKVLRYVATATLADGGEAARCAVLAPATSCVMENLNLDVSYSVVVRAENAVGLGPASAPSSTLAMPDASVHIPDMALRALIANQLGKAASERITRADMATLTELTGVGLGIADLTGIQFAINLTRLDLSVNSISDISSLAGLTRLAELHLSENEIMDISALSQLTGLTRLSLNDNSIGDISPLAGLTRLAELPLSYNEITDISALSQLTGLTRLDLSANIIGDISPLAGLTRLTDLALSSNDISDISALSGLTGLIRLYLNANSIGDISPLAGLTRLTGLYLSSNEVSDISVLSDLTSLTRLSLDANGISDISPLAGLTRLTDLSLSSNEISDISALPDLTGLTRLALDENSISDITSLARLTALTTLRLSNNAITDVSPLVSNGGLDADTVIHLYGNPISDESFDLHIPALKARGVRVIDGLRVSHDLSLVDEFPDSRMVQVYNDNVIVMRVEEDVSTTAVFDALADYTTDFYHWFEDEFDYLLFLSNMSGAEYLQFPYAGRYRPVMNETEGLGMRQFSQNARYGSAGRLRGLIHLPFPYLQRGPSLHELLHAWANYAVPTAVGGHWGFSSANGQLGGFDIANLVDLGDGLWTAGLFGTYANGGNGVPYSPIELYFAGLVPPEEVPDLWVAEDGKWLVENDAYVWTDNGDPVFTAENVRTYTIEDIIAEHGPRNPAAARRDQRAAVILLTDDEHQIDAYDLYAMSEHAAWLELPDDDGLDWIYNFYEATDGRATLTLSGLAGVRKSEAAAPANLPASFGVPLPPATVSGHIHDSSPANRETSPHYGEFFRLDVR